VREVRKSVGPEQDWTGELEPWMGSLKANSIANLAKNFVQKQRGPLDEAVIKKNIESTEGLKKIYKDHEGGSGGGGLLGGNLSK